MTPALVLPRHTHSDDPPESRAPGSDTALHSKRTPWLLYRLPSALLDPWGHRAQRGKVICLSPVSQSKAKLRDCSPTALDMRILHPEKALYVLRVKKKNQRREQGDKRKKASVERKSMV